MEGEWHMDGLMNKVVLITGAASGIGAACARAFVAAGARVLVSDLAEAPAQELARSLGGSCRAVQGDHRDRADNERAIAAAIAAWGRLDVLVNNAGVPARGAFHGVDDVMIDRVIGTNVIGPYRMTQAALPHLLNRSAKGGQPSILFMASIQSLMVRPGFTLYSTSKHGLGGLIGSLALELAPKGIRVNGLCPGPVLTPLLRQSLPPEAEDEEAGLERFRAGIPLGRLITPEDVAHAALFLTSDGASAITGVMLPVDGGITAR
jgi:NAD(P)-dependent dehydrogenase (short-subunit alcohol dehydrogenase family)